MALTEDERRPEGNIRPGFMRHLLACGNAELPGRRHALRLRTEDAEPQVGWITPEFAVALSEDPAVAVTPDGLCVEAKGLTGLARRTSQRGLNRWRNEAFDVREHIDGPVLAQIDRGALPIYGIEAAGVHVNGLVETARSTRLWVARRAAHKALDPNKLDHLVAGGVPAGLSPEQTLVKEAEEEASVPADLARQARHVSTIRYAMERFEGLRRDTLFCYDLTLPESFQPHPNDDEVAAFELWPLERVADTVSAGDDFKFNVNLVLIDLLIRRGIIQEPDASALREALARNASAP